MKPSFRARTAAVSPGKRDARRARICRVRGDPLVQAPAFGSRREGACPCGGGCPACAPPQPESGDGLPLPPAERAYFEPRFGRDFSRVRLHQSADAADVAHEVGARAFTVGADITFGRGQYTPGSGAFRRLLAHELAHVVQQAGRSDQRVQRSCGAPPRRFRLAGSRVGTLIRDGLAALTVAHPFRRGERMPVVPPDRVLEILSLSPCFLRVAASVQRLYLSRGAQRSPPLTFRFHANPNVGSHFERGASRVTVHVTSLADAVRTIVHEVVHAWHRAPRAARPAAGVGAVTRVEEAQVREESATRGKENEIMGQIYAANGLPRRPAEATDAATVRGDFRSGLPRLTYQEYFIGEEMKNRTRPAGIDEGAVTRTAQAIIATRTVEYVRPGVSFRLDAPAVTRHRRRAASPVPTPPPTVDQAMEAVRVFRAYGRRMTAAMVQRLRRIGPGCPQFIADWHGFIWRNEPYRRLERRDFFHRILRELRVRHQLQGALHESSTAFARWYESVPEDGRSRALEYFEWVLIEESMSAEWLRSGRPAANVETRRRHLDFLSQRIGRDLRGVSRP